MSEPEWTRARPSLNQKSVIDYMIAANQLMRESGVVQVDRTDIGASNHYLVWLELGRTTKHSRKGKRVIRKWPLDRLGVCGRAARWWDAEVKAKIEYRRDVYRKIAGGQDELWEEYYMLRKEVKNLVIEKKLGMKC